MKTSRRIRRKAMKNSSCRSETDISHPHYIDEYTSGNDVQGTSWPTDKTKSLDRGQDERRKIDDFRFSVIYSQNFNHDFQQFDSTFQPRERLKNMTVKDAILDIRNRRACSPSTLFHREVSIESNTCSNFVASKLSGSIRQTGISIDFHPNNYLVPNTEKINQPHVIQTNAGTKANNMLAVCHQLTKITAQPANVEKRIRFSDVCANVSIMHFSSEYYISPLVRVNENTTKEQMNYPIKQHEVNSEVIEKPKIYFSDEVLEINSAEQLKSDHKRTCFQLCTQSDKIDLFSTASTIQISPKMIENYIITPFSDPVKDMTKTDFITSRNDLIYPSCQKVLLSGTCSCIPSIYKPSQPLVVNKAHCRFANHCFPQSSSMEFTSIIADGYSHTTSTINYSLSSNKISSFTEVCSIHLNYNDFMQNQFTPVCINFKEYIDSQSTTAIPFNPTSISCQHSEVKKKVVTLKSGLCNRSEGNPSIDAKPRIFPSFTYTTKSVKNRVESHTRYAPTPEKRIPVSTLASENTSKCTNNSRNGNSSSTSSINSSNSYAIMQRSTIDTIAVNGLTVDITSLLLTNVIDNLSLPTPTQGQRAPFHENVVNSIDIGPPKLSTEQKLSMNKDFLFSYRSTEVRPEILQGYCDHKNQVSSEIISDEYHKKIDMNNVNNYIQNASKPFPVVFEGNSNDTKTSFFTSTKCKYYENKQNNKYFKISETKTKRNAKPFLSTCASASMKRLSAGKKASHKLVSTTSISSSANDNKGNLVIADSAHPVAKKERSNSKNNEVLNNSQKNKRSMKLSTFAISKIRQKILKNRQKKNRKATDQIFSEPKMNKELGSKLLSFIEHELNIEKLCDIKETDILEDETIEESKEIIYAMENPLCFPLGLKAPIQSLPSTFSVFKHDTSSQKNSKAMHRKRKCLHCCKQFIAFFFSHVGLCSLVVGYTILGGFIFRALESGHEYVIRSEVKEHREMFMNRVTNLATLYKESKLSLYNVTNALRSELITYQSFIYDKTTNEGWDGKEDGNTSDSQGELWSFASSLLYAITVMTTIGKTLVSCACCCCCCMLLFLNQQLHRRLRLLAPIVKSMKGKVFLSTDPTTPEL